MERTLKAYRTGKVEELIPPDKRAQLVAKAENPTEPYSAENTLRVLEQLMGDLPSEVGSVRDFVSPELLNAGGNRILEEIIAITPLDPQHQRVLMECSPSASFDTSPEMQRQASAAFESLIHACLTTMDEHSTRRGCLLLAFMFGSLKLNLTSGQVSVFKDPMQERLATAQHPTHNTVAALLGSTAVGRRFAVTKRGYMALVPVDAVVGDVVAVFVGGQVPFILRSHGNGEGKERYPLVGEGYLHGFMDGLGIEGVMMKGICLV